MAEIERSQVDLYALSTFLESLRLYHEFLVQIPREDQLIYHYTDLGALNGILSGHDLWLTNARYSNDEDESRRGYAIAREIVNAYSRSAKRARPRDELRVAYAEMLSALVESPPPEGFYICCFCEKDNLLSQWRSYGANGTGVSLAFDPTPFIHISGADMPLGLMRLWKVSYNIAQQKRIVKRAIDFVWDKSADDHQSANDLARRAADAIQFFVPTFKNADFREEKERRLIFTPDPACTVKPRYRVGRGMLIPYYSVRDLAETTGLKVPSAWRLPIRSIMVGPSAQKELNVESTTMLLQQNGYDGVDVRASATPYRG
jgi:hypothetical protein